MRCFRFLIIELISEFFTSSPLPFIVQKLCASHSQNLRHSLKSSRRKIFQLKLLWWKKTNLIKKVYVGFLWGFFYYWHLLYALMTKKFFFVIFRLCHRCFRKLNFLTSNHLIMIFFYTHVNFIQIGRVFYVIKCVK